jgi:hypothetical protein
MTPHIRSHLAIFSRFAGGESIASLADDFDLSIENVEEMLQLQAQVFMTGKGRSRFNKLLAKYTHGQTPSAKYKTIVFAGVYACTYGYSLPDWIREEYSIVCKELFNPDTNTGLNAK